MRIRDIFWCFMISATILFMSNRAYSAQPYDAVAKIDHGSWTGSASLIRTYHNGEYAVLLSCRHVAGSEGDVVKVLWPSAGGQESKGVVATVMRRTSDDGHVTANPNVWQTDLAIILCPAPKGVKPLEYTTFDPDNVPWVSMGYRGKNMWFTVSTDNIEYNGTILGHPNYIGGESGGALLDKHGRLVGVVVAGDDKYNIGVSVDGANLKKILEMYAN